MRLLILSELIDKVQKDEELKFTPPYDVQLDISNLNDEERFNYSVFDYDVAILHISQVSNNFKGYLRNLQKMSEDVLTALEHGRTVIILPESKNIQIPNSRTNVYTWLYYNFGVLLRSNFGEDIKPSGAGRSNVIKEYLKSVNVYQQIVIEPKAKPEQRLAVVDDTEIVVGLEQPFEQGTLVILPSPTFESDFYFLSMSKLVDVAKWYYERAQRMIPVGDAPDWIQNHFVPTAIDLNQQIEKLTAEKLRYDRIAYILYGTGGELEESVAQLLEELGMKVTRTAPGANIDLTAKHTDLDIGFAIEVTGTKGKIRKDSKKIAQAMRYIIDRAGTSQENDRLIIVANTEYHLDPKDRSNESFTPDAVKILDNNGILLLTTLQLYELWKAIHEGKKSKEDVLIEFHKKQGLYKSK